MKQPAVTKLPEAGKITSNSEELDPRKITMDLEARIPSISKMPEADRVRAVSIIMQKVEMSSGPLPPPAALEHYEVILPGAADRIVKMAESSLSHDQMVQLTILEAEIAASNSDQQNRTKGLNIAFFTIFGMLILVGGLAYLNQPWLAGLVSAGPIGVIVKHLIEGSSIRNSKSVPTQTQPSPSQKRIKKK